MESRREIVSLRRLESVITRFTASRPATVVNATLRNLLASATTMTSLAQAIMARLTWASSALNSVRPASRCNPPTPRKKLIHEEVPEGALGQVAR